MRGARKDVGAKREQHRGDRGRFAATGQMPDEVIRASRREHERHQHDRVVGEIRVAGQSPGGNRDQSRADVGLRIRQRVLGGIEDVRVEQSARIHDERIGHPGDVPDTEASIVGVHAPDMAEAWHERIREGRGEQQRSAEDGRPFNEAAQAHVAGMVPWRSSSLPRAWTGNTSNGPPARAHLPRRTQALLVPWVSPLRDAVARACRRRTHGRAVARLRLWDRRQPCVARPSWAGLRFRFLVPWTGLRSRTRRAAGRQGQHRRHAVRRRELRRRHVVRCALQLARRRGSARGRGRSRGC